MSDSLVCKMPGCGGMLGDETFPLQTGCSSYSPCLACRSCGRVHSNDGFLMFSRPGKAVYLREDGVELVMEPKIFEVGKKYKTMGNIYVCLEEKAGGDCVMPDMVDLEPGTPFIFDGMDGETFRFHGEDGTEYRLHRGDVNAVKEA